MISPVSHALWRLFSWRVAFCAWKSHQTVRGAAMLGTNRPLDAWNVADSPNPFRMPQRRTHESLMGGKSSKLLSWPRQSALHYQACIYIISIDRTENDSRRILTDSRQKTASRSATQAESGPPGQAESGRGVRDRETNIDN